VCKRPTKHLDAVGHNPFDQFVHGISQGRGTATAIRQQAIAFRHKIGLMRKTGLNEEDLATLFKSGAPHLIDARRMVS